MLGASSRHDPHRCPGHLCGTITTPLSKLRPQLGIAVHLHADAFGTLSPAARIEQAGTITTALLAELLHDHRVDVTIQPVIDLPETPAADRYTPTPRMRRAVSLALPTEPFPYSTRASHGLDLDHTVAYQPGHPAQTRLGNLAPLSRTVHRAKTAGHWQLSQPQPGTLHWRSPLGYRYRVTTDVTGTTTVPIASDLPPP